MRIKLRMQSPAKYTCDADNKKGDLREKLEKKIVQKDLHLAYRKGDIYAVI